MSKAALAAKVKAADDQNVLRLALSKVKEGKPLSARERKAVESAADVQDAQEEELSGLPEWAKSAPPYFKSIVEAAKHIQCDRKTLTRWKKLGCTAFRADGRINSIDLGRWCIREGRDTGIDAEPDILEEKKRLLTAQADLAELRFQRENGALIEKDAIRDECASIMASFAALVAREFREHATRYSDRSVPEIESIAMSKEKTFLHEFRRLLDRIE